VSRPDRGAWKPAQRVKNDILFGTACAAVRLCLGMPRAWLPWFGELAGRTCYAMLSSARRTALANLALVHPDRDRDALRAHAKANFASLGRNLADAISLLDPTEAPGRTLALPEASRRELREALAGGRGVIYVTAHLGPWERMAALLASSGFAITTLARESYDPRFHQLLYEKLRTRRNVEAIYRGSPGAAFAMVRALRRGRVLGMLVDLPGRVPTRPALLLGLPARLPIGPVRLALRTGSPVVVGTPAPGPDGTLQVQITQLPTKDLGPGDVGEALLIQRLADALSERIYALSAHWPWMHPSFDTELPLNSTGRFT
jgi:KDO2-lipid IV(A) lauroyltransferase